MATSSAGGQNRVGRVIGLCISLLVFLICLLLVGHRDEIFVLGSCTLMRIDRGFYFDARR